MTSHLADPELLKEAEDLCLKLKAQINRWTRYAVWLEAKKVRTLIEIEEEAESKDCHPRILELCHEKAQVISRYASEARTKIELLQLKKRALKEWLISKKVHHLENQL